MAESQLTCMEDGRIGANVPETKPEYYYSEGQRAALEELLKNGDGAFKTRLKDDQMTDFLSAREVKVLTGTFKSYEAAAAAAAETQRAGAAPDAGDEDSGVHSTYWPQMSDTEVPPLDMGWPSGGLFKGVTRVAVHTHPPKDNGPHIKEVVRRLIQEASKVIAIVMDLLTDVQILQDLMDASFRRSVAVYILLDNPGVPHFLDMCSRLQIGSQHLRNIRARTLQGVGFCMSFGRLPGAVCNKYMLIDGDKVMFGSYSFSWATSRMDRNMITVMTGQVVDFFDRDFRELYAISENLDLYKEFHASRVSANTTSTLRSKVGPKRPPLPATTSRFQVTLGDSSKDKVVVPAHKYYNPKYSLVFGDVIRPTGSLQEKGPKRGSTMAKVPEDMEEGAPRVTTSEKLDRLSPMPSEAPSDIFKRAARGGTQERKATWKQKIFSRKSSNRPPGPNATNNRSPSPAEPNRTGDNELAVTVRAPSRWRGNKMGRKTESQQTINAPHDNESMKSRTQGKQKCTVS